MLMLSVFVVLFVILMVAFLMYINVLSGKEDLTVYRMMGVKRDRIVLSYIMEIWILTFATALPVLVLASVVFGFLDTIPYISVGFYLPAWGALLVLAALTVINSLLSALPARRILRKPPAVIKP